MKTDAIVEAIENGATTTDEIADAVDRHRNHMTRVLLRLTAEGDEYDTATAPLTRERTAQGFEYSVNPAWESNRERAASDGSSDEFDRRDSVIPSGEDAEAATGIMPVVRDYDFESDAYTATTDAEYVPTDGELEEIQALIDARNTPGIDPHFSIGGPTGCGKTTLAESLAAEYGAAWFEIQMFPDMSSADLLGSPSISANGTTWADGTLVKALLCSKERLTFLLIDEANRAPARVSNILFNALDHRCRVTLDGPRGGEVIQGNPSNLVVFSTLNVGSEYHGTHDMDAAAKRRLGFRKNVNYLGIEYPEREAGLIAERAGVSKMLAEDMVTDVANSVRERAADYTSRNISTGIPTAAMISWASAAVAFDSAGIDDPICAAAESAVIEPYYGDDNDAADTVRQMIHDVFSGAPVNSGDYASHADNERVYCTECDFDIPQAQAEEDGLLVEHECPDCDGYLRTYTRE